MFIGDMRRQAGQNRLSLIHHTCVRFTRVLLNLITPARSFQLPPQLPGVGAHSVNRRLKKMTVLYRE